ncbi:MAG: DUF4276 family protein [Victivallales bacterium]
MNSTIYLEGGGDSKELHVRCREGFRKLLEKCGFVGRMPRLSACGGRNEVFDDFKRALSKNRNNAYIAMWIDSEDPMSDIKKAWDHLKNVSTVDKWDMPQGANDEQVLFMTTCMETWIIADRDTLKAHYGSKLRESGLPSPINIERQLRHDIQDKLEHATRNCSNAYEKGKRSFVILSKLNTDTLKRDLPSFARVRRILEDKL